MSNRIIGRLIRQESDDAAFLTYYVDYEGDKRLTIFGVDEASHSHFRSGVLMQVFLSRISNAKSNDTMGSYIAGNVIPEIYTTE